MAYEVDKPVEGPAMIDNRQVHIHHHEPQPLPGISRSLGFFDMVILVVFVLPFCIGFFGGQWGGLVWAALCFFMAGFFGRLVFGFLFVSMLMTIFSHANAEIITECYKLGDKVICSKRNADLPSGDPFRQQYQMPTTTECYYIGRKLVCKEH